MSGALNKMTSAEAFKGLMAPVFTCFNQHGLLELQYIDVYAKWLKSHQIRGVMVNSIAGEGPALGVQERKKNAEAWCRACNKLGLQMLLQVGGAPLPDVLELAEHANNLNVQGVALLPELFYKPRHMDQLLGYCKIIAQKFSSRPFLYYHIPRYTGVDFDMMEFCQKAEIAIPNFLGLVYDSNNLDMGYRCLRKGRVMLLADGRLLASGMMLGFESAIPLSINILPDMVLEIYNGMKEGNLAVVKETQKQLISMVRFHASHISIERFMSVMKNWFNEEMNGENGAGFSAGMTRKLY